MIVELNLPSNDIVTGLGILFGLVGVCVTVWYARTSRPLYALSLSKLGGVRHNNLEIRFGNTEIDNLYLLRQVLWNGGKKEIRKEDIPKRKAGPYVSLSNNCEILSFHAETTTGDNSAEYILDGNDLLLSFDYLNKSDAFLGEIYFTSTDDIDPKYSVEGTLIGAPLHRGELVNNSVFSTVFNILSFVFFILVSGVFGYQLFFGQIESFSHKVGTFVSFILCLIVTIADFHINVKEIPNRVPPKYSKYLSEGKASVGPIFF